MAGEIQTVAASPNAFSRNAIDVQVSHTDVSGWNPPSGGAKTVEYTVDGGVTWVQAGFWTPTSNICGTQNTDFNDVDGTTSATLSDFTIYAPDDLPHATLVRVRVRANTIDGTFTESTDTRTRDYPTFACAPADVTTTTATFALADDAPTGQTNVATCGADTIIWEYGTTPGGPYTTVLPSEPVSSYSPDKAVTGLSPGTTYYYRARLSEVTDTHGEYLVTQECSFTTTAAVDFAPACSVPGPVTATTAPVAGTADTVPADHTILLALGTAPGGPYTTLSPATAGNGTADQTVTHTFTGLTASTTYYFRAEVRDAGNAVVDSSAECSFTTQTAPEPPGPRPFEPQPCDTGGAGADAVDVEQIVLCDMDEDGTLLGTALAVYEYDADGNPTGAPTFVDPATGAPYVPQGVLQPCGNTPGTAQVYATCADVPREAIVSGPNLIDNGDFADSEGIGATSTAGPGFTTGYAFPSPCDDIFTACGGAGSMAYFNTNAGQVAGGGTYPSANSIQALTTKSLAVNVGPDTSQPIICWQVPLVAGRMYELSADVAIINQPYSIKLTIDGADVLPLTAPDFTGEWQRRSDRFTWSGTTGLHTLCLASNSGEPAGNDHAFDNFTLRQVSPDQEANLSECEYDTRVRACIEHVVQIVGCNDDRRDSILANIASAAGGGVANQIVVDAVCVNNETWSRVTLYETGAGSVVDTKFFGPDGTQQTAPASYTIGACTTRDTEIVELCDVQASGAAVAFLRVFTYDETGAVTSVENQDADGAPYEPSGTVTVCSLIDSQAQLLCDAGNGGRSFLRNVVRAGGVFAARTDTELDGLTAYAAVGPVGVCGSDLADREAICYTLATTGAEIHAGWARHQDSLPNTPQTPNGIAFFDATGNFLDPTQNGFTVVPCVASCEPVATTGVCLADGTPIAVVVRRDCDTGVVTQDGWINLTTGLFTTGQPPAGTMACGDTASIQVSGTFCDVDTNGDVQALVLIEYHYGTDGSIESVRLVDATTGATYVPVGTITSCPSGTSQPDQDLVVLCDITPAGAAPFLRDYRRDQNGAIVGHTDYTLAGALYAPSGAVRLCQVEDSVTLYESTVQDVAGGATFTITPGDDLVSWNARNRNATTATIQVNGGPVLPLDTAETIGTDLTGSDRNDVIQDTVVISPGDGSVRVMMVRRLP